MNVQKSVPPRNDAGVLFVQGNNIKKKSAKWGFIADVILQAIQGSPLTLKCTKFKTCF